MQINPGGRLDTKDVMVRGISRKVWRNSGKCCRTDVIMVVSLAMY